MRLINKNIYNKKSIIIRIILTQLDFKLIPVENIPTRKFRKGSKYDPIIDTFLEQDGTLVELVVEDMDANYIRTQIKKRIDSRNLKVGVSVANNIVYLEK